jgi:hypothetical protein
MNIVLGFLRDSCKPSPGLWSPPHLMGEDICRYLQVFATCALKAKDAKSGPMGAVLAVKTSAWKQDASRSQSGEHPPGFHFY